MNKKKFMIYQTTHPKIQCRECKRILEIKNFSYWGIHDDNTGICRACDWTKRNNEKMKYENYSYELLENIIRFVFENNGENGNCVVNEMVDKYSLNLEEIINILQHLKIGNKPYGIKVNCECCGKEVYVHISKYLLNDYIYCSTECYWKDKPNKMPKGKNNKQYNRIETFCTNCGKEISTIPSNYNKKNRFDESHNFCCLECYWEYRSKYYVDEKSNGKYICWTDELKDKMRENMLLRMSDDNRLNTKPQLEVNSILEELNIAFEREYLCKYYSIDNYLSEYNLMIEVMGDYWHANPTRFNKDKYLLTSKQFEGIHRDKLKQSYIFNHYQIKILYLWEEDIIKRRELCKLLIQLYIKSNGILNNYHSFNYDLIDGKIILKDHIILPYQNQNINEYKSLSKKTS